MPYGRLLDWTVGASRPWIQNNSLEAPLRCVLWRGFGSSEASWPKPGPTSRKGDPGAAGGVERTRSDPDQALQSASARSMDLVQAIDHATFVMKSSSR
jgi:hypothetical protein